MPEKINSSKTDPADEEFVITRVFNSPCKHIFEMWTEPKHLSRWWGPKGFIWVDCKIDLRPEGEFHYCMHSPDGFEMWGKFVYQEISAPYRLIFVVSFSDKDGNTRRHPISPNWPLEVLNTLTLTEHEGKTTIIIQGRPINASEEERRTFKEGYKSMQQGLKGTFDQLEDYLTIIIKGTAQ